MSERENFFARWSRRKRVAAPAHEPSLQQTSMRATDSVGSLRPCGEGVGTGVAAGPQPDASRATPSQHEGGEVRAARSGTQTASANPEGTTRRASVKSEHSPDLSKLPAIESITADTDISGFLASGVPAELTRAALRRAWSADPRIRDFIGLSENSWDFNAPDAMGGFGPLEMTDELRRQILEMVGRGLDAPDAADPNGEAASQAPVEQPTDQSMTRLAQPPADEEPRAAQAPQHLTEPASDTRSCAQEDDHARPRPIVKRSHGGALPR
jgi:hypothetical protein